MISFQQMSRGCKRWETPTQLIFKLFKEFNYIYGNPMTMIFIDGWRFDGARSEIKKQL